MSWILYFNMLFANVTEKSTFEYAHTCTHTTDAYRDTHATQMCTPRESRHTFTHGHADTQTEPLPTPNSAVCAGALRPLRPVRPVLEPLLPLPGLLWPLRPQSCLP